MRKPHFRRPHATVSRRTVLAGFVASLATPCAATGATGLDLIMVDEPGCVYCRKWDAEIGRGYGRTDQGRFAPLTRVRRKSRELANLNPVIYTPTFILVRRGEELGRITGYPGAEFFYPELDALLAQAGYAPGLPAMPSGPASQRT